MRYMVDSTSAADSLRQPADMYAGYTDGRYVNVAALRAGTDKPVVEISAVGTNTGVVGDCEPGCIWPQSEIVDWVVARRRSGVDPTVYVGAANLASVVAAFNTRGVPQPVAYWTAHYTNVPHFCGTGCSYGRGLGVNVVATQYGGDLDGHFDANHVADYWPGVDPAEHASGGGSPLAPPVDFGGALSQEDDDMARLDDIIKITEPGSKIRNGATYFLGMNGWSWLDAEQLEQKRVLGKIKPNQPILVSAQQADFYFEEDGLRRDIDGAKGNL